MLSFVLLTACSFAGTYTLYEDRFVLSPSAWDNEYARVVWMQVKSAE